MGWKNCEKHNVETMSLRSRIKRGPPRSQPPVSTATGIEKNLLGEFRAKTTSADMDVLSQIGSGATRNQQFGLNQTARATIPPPRLTQNPTREVAQLKQQVAQLSSTVQNWHQVLSEITQAVFLVCATCIVERVPYYLELPDGKRALKAPEGHINEGDKVTLMYPQLPHPDMLYMRVRKCDSRCGDIQLFYVPIANVSMSPQELYESTGINSSAEQYFDYFHNPGDKDPNPALQA